MLAYVPVQNTLPLPVPAQDALLINAIRKFYKLDSFASLKGTLTRDLRPLVFFSHQTTPSRPLRHGLKPFAIWISIRRENRLCNRQFLSQRNH
jgi:hypothetical protein